MWPFKDAKMLRRELFEHRTYREALQAAARNLEERLADAHSALARVTVKRDVLVLQTEMQRREIDRLKAALAGASVREPRTGRYGRATHV